MDDEKDLETPVYAIRVRKGGAGAQSVIEAHLSGVLKHFLENLYLVHVSHDPSFTPIAASVG